MVGYIPKYTRKKYFISHKKLLSNSIYKIIESPYSRDILCITIKKYSERNDITGIYTFSKSDRIYLEYPVLNWFRPSRFCSQIHTDLICRNVRQEVKSLCGKYDKTFWISIPIKTKQNKMLAIACTKSPAHTLLFFSI